ncbi:hypothetical protein NR798_46435 [Archangium gephyra]|uniref:hypothetical protein n=1 Tax=Archangium gephyra TaxID=48 RepID=UPI0035D4ABD6
MNPHTSIDGVEVDDALWPLLVVRFLGVPTTAQVQAYLERVTGYLERDGRHAVIFDSSGMTGIGQTHQYHLQAEWLKRHDARLKQVRLGAAYIIQSPVVRLAVSVVYYLRPTTMPYLITAKQGEAAGWAAARLDEDGQHEAAQRVREHFGLNSQRHTG